MKKINAGTIIKLLLALFLVACVAILFLTFRDAYSLGQAVGEMPGQFVGKVIGGAEGNKQGEEAGRQEAIDNPEVEVTAENTINNIGKLEVLSVNIKLTDFFSIGSNADYALLYDKDATAVYSVDLTNAHIHEAGNTITVILPPIEVEAYIDDSAPNIIDEYQKGNKVGDTQSAIDAWNNSSKEMKDKAIDALINDKGLKENAESNAIKQVTSILRALTNKDVEVTFSSGGMFQ